MSLPLLCDQRAVRRDALKRAARDRTRSSSTTSSLYYASLRSRFWNLVASVDPQLAASSPSEKVSCLLGDSTPRELSLFFYRFLQEVFESRRLAELNTQGEGSRA